MRATPSRLHRGALLAAASLVLALPVHPAVAQQALKPQLTGAQLVEALQGGGLVVIFRHMATNPFTGDPNDIDLEDCTTQRNLSDEGRDAAVLVGRAIKTLRIPVGRVMSSPYCRCRDTARLVFGGFNISDTLAVGDELTSAQKDAMGAKIREMLAERPFEGTNTFLVTHTGNLLYSYGLQVRPEGIAHVFRPAGFGKAFYVGTLLPKDWVQLAGLR